ncbi:MAG: ABC transporter substrate-binding protein [Acutalibacteraceae bacterium]
MLKESFSSKPGKEASLGAVEAKMKKIISLLLCFVLLFLGLSACSNNADNTEQTTEETTLSESETTQPAPVVSKNITIGYYSDQSFNPFKTKSKTNCLLASLIYDSLFKINAKYDASPSIAKSYINGEKTLTVTLRDDMIFSNSAAVTAQDVVYSFTKAKKSKMYSARLSNFKSALANGNEVVFLLKNEDIYAVNCLDFPVVSSGTADDKIPVGSGRYILEKKSGEYFLSKNENYSGAEEVELEKINLFDINKAENELYLLQIGDLSFVFDDHAKDDSAIKISANTVSVSLNNLVYLAFNSKSEVLKDSKVKQAVCLALDKTTICSKAYGSLASVCTTVFNPAWSVVSAFSKKKISSDAAAAQQLLEDGKYVYAYDTSTVRSKNFEYLELDFIVSKSDERKMKAADEIKSQLNKIGIGVKLEALEHDDFISRLENEDYDLYLGETKLTGNMSLYEFFTESGSVNYGIDSNSTVAGAYSDFAGGRIDISTFINVFEEYMPFIPLCYRNGTAYYSREIQFDSEISENDIFANIYSWEQKS